MRGRWPPRRAARSSAGKRRGARRAIRVGLAPAATLIASALENARLLWRVELRAGTSPLRPRIATGPCSSGRRTRSSSQTIGNVVVDANPAARRLFGTELVGGHMGTGRDRVGRRRGQADGSVTRPGPPRRRGPASGWMGRRSPSRSRPRRSRSTARTGSSGVVRDLTERSQLQQELLQAQKMEAIGLLVAGVAHELNNPLASIVAFSQLIRTDPTLPDELHHQADLLIQEANRTRRIVQNLLDFARQRPPERVPTSIRDADRQRPRAPVLHVRCAGRIDGHGRRSRTTSARRRRPRPDPAGPHQPDPQRRPGDPRAGSRGSHRDQDARRDRGDGGADRPRLGHRRRARASPRRCATGCSCRSSRRRHQARGPASGCRSRSGSSPATAAALRYEPGPGGSGATFIIELPVEPNADGDRRGSAGRRPSRGAPRPDRPRRSPTGRPTGRVTGPARRTRPRTAAVAGPRPRRRARDPRLPRPRSCVAAATSRCSPRIGLRPWRIVADRSARRDPLRPPDGRHERHGVPRRRRRDRPELARRFVFMSGDVLNPELRDFADVARDHAAGQAVRHRERRSNRDEDPRGRSGELTPYERRRLRSGRSHGRSSGRGDPPRPAR